MPEHQDNLYSCILPYLKKQKIPVKLVPGAFDITTLLLMAASGLGIALIPCSYRECGPPGLIYRDIADSSEPPMKTDLFNNQWWSKTDQQIMQTDEIYVTPLGFGIRIDGNDSGHLFPSRETAEAYVPTLLRNRRPTRRGVDEDQRVVAASLKQAAK